jgi:hypothetical protein
MCSIGNIRKNKEKTLNLAHATKVAKRKAANQYVNAKRSRIFQCGQCTSNFFPQTRARLCKPQHPNLMIAVQNFSPVYPTLSQWLWLFSRKPCQIVSEHLPYSMLSTAVFSRNRLFFVIVLSITWSQRRQRGRFRRLRWLYRWST